MGRKMYEYIRYLPAEGGPPFGRCVRAAGREQGDDTERKLGIRERLVGMYASAEGRDAGFRLQSLFNSVYVGVVRSVCRECLMNHHQSQRQQQLQQQQQPAQACVRTDSVMPWRHRRSSFSEMWVISHLLRGRRAQEGEGVTTAGDGYVSDSPCVWMDYYA
ncbi:uncharacterized protein K489DRAFT_126441 [Dissoconium aciculare CBS 342.82]|jgi:hypothetical protein|uniref:Uncharacterized protein n=1 Tax=Dissoconium aciculare CBS 342.82 TaxID=1314786 RepID=A0A6J3MIT8_9PEZI|nr:uncharacterized protein K489DRAFT_126441 [Dissoconium aciculare CBS 342.82]KAF1826827.1 hypothetical protein K489DRAFT_126441 [Dissoconium aciculare CBS 342.82]